MKAYEYNSTIENIKTRRSIRDYLDTPILVKNLEGRKDAGAVNFLKRLQDKNFNLFYNAPVLILVIGSKNNTLTDYLRISKDNASDP